MLGYTTIVIDMAAEKALALVVRGTDWSETSRITTLWTREFGKVRAVAKGGRRLNSSFEIAFDLLTVCRVVYLRTRFGGLDILTEAQVAERFPALRSDLQSLYAGYYVAELLADGTQDYDPHPLLFDNAIDLLRDLDAGLTQSNDKPAKLLATVSRFELVWLRELGYAPRLDACAVCDRDLSVPPPDAARVAYSPEAGGVVCPDCLPNVRDRRPLSVAAWLALRGLADATDARSAPALPATLRGEVRGLLGFAVSSVLSRRPRLLSYLEGG